MAHVPQDDQQSTLTDHPRAGGEALRLLVPGLVILSHPEPRRVGETVALARLASGQAVELSRREPRFAQPGRETPRPLADPYLSRRPVLLKAGPQPGSVILEPSSGRPSVWVDGETVREPRLFTAEAIERGVPLVLHRRVALLLCRVDPLPRSLPRYGLVGDAVATQGLRREIRSAAALEVPVLLRGETGTGKELVARALHQASRRRDRPFLAVNMGALTPSLAASELFGAARGAFTGADRKKPGLFRSADGGTLFLDEIGEAPVEVQVMLLRALESQEIQPVGSTETVAVDVRVIAATDAALESAISSGRFRAPLLHRLAGFEIHLPPLRSRRDDIARLLFHFVALEAAGLEVPPESAATSDEVPPESAATSDEVPPESAASTETVPSEALRHGVPPESAGDVAGNPVLPAELVARLAAHDWPGNVRQLRNVARRLVIAGVQGAGPAELEQLVEQLLGPRVESVPGDEPASSSEAAPARPDAVPAGYARRFRRAVDVSEEELLAALAKHRWQPQPAAAELGVSRPTMYRLMQSCRRVRKAVELQRDEITAALEGAGHDLAQAAQQLEVSLQGLKRRMTQLGLDTSPAR